MSLSLFLSLSVCVCRKKCEMWSALPLLLLTRPLVQRYCCCFSCYIEKKSAYYLPTHIFLSLSLSLLHKTDSTLKFATFFPSKFITYHLMLWLQSIDYMNKSISSARLARY